jgi:GAF domain-containing protein
LLPATLAGAGGTRVTSLGHARCHHHLREMTTLTDHELRIAQALSDAAAMMNAPTSVEETLQAIARAAVITVPGFDHVGVSITHRDQRIETMAATDALVCELDEIQYKLHEGPCYDAIRGAGVMVVENARHDQRWPTYMPEAVQRGLRSQLAIGLYADEHSLGGINLYSTSLDRIEDDAVGVAELFAGQAAVALGRSRHDVQLDEALESRRLIGQAIGIVQERYKVDEDHAFEYLIRTSSTSNVKLRDIAAELVRVANERSAR